MDADKAHFNAIPWCAQLLADPNIIIEPVESRIQKASTEDAFFSETLQTKNTIAASLTFYTRPTSDTERINNLNVLMTLGYAVNGYPQVAHGGLVATIMDESMGLLLHVNRPRGSVPWIGNTVTAYLNVSYVKAVPTPATILVSTELKEVAGRKYFTRATVKDASGEVLAKAEALFIGVKRTDENL
jgi:acyl-coenzyme A thioesterase PaaI-like protein